MASFTSGAQMSSCARQRHRQVVGPQADHVDAVEREDLVELIERAFGLDLRAGDGPGVGGLEIIAFVRRAERPVRAPAAIAARRIFHRLHEGLGVVDASRSSDT